MSENRWSFFRKQEHLHSYNSQKCINDHQQREDLGGTGDKRLTNKIFSRMKLYFPWASSGLKYQTIAKIEKRIKSKLGKKKKKFKSFFLSYKARCAHLKWEGQSFSVQQSAPNPLFLDFNALEKALISWVQYFKIETQTSFSMNIQKKHKIFQCLRDWINSLGGCFCLSIRGHLLANKKWIVLMEDSWLKCYAPDLS